MKDSIDFGKVQTYEELKMLREIEKYYIKRRKHGTIKIARANVV
ncbi:hypothetical protein QUW22_02085 [Ligilactobacillus salivarius]|nr:hypothetical protein [Ligilactobacillus salivarius]MDM8222965.1 hypothetical protein [Ligilactobacillus salivarius]